MPDPYDWAVRFERDAKEMMVAGEYKPLMWTKFPLPRTRMPSSRNGASFLPISKWNDAGLFSSMLSWTTGMSASGYTCRSTDHVFPIEGVLHLKDGEALEIAYIAAFRQ